MSRLRSSGGNSAVTAAGCRGGRLDGTANSADRLMSGTATRNGLSNTVGEITQTARALRSLADYLDRHPEALIRGRLRSHAMTPRLIPVLLILTLTACASSPPTRFFALDAVAPGASPAAQRAAGTSAPVKVDAVHIPPALDRESMVRGASGNQLEISSQDRWAGDLGEMIRRVLTQDLAARLPPGTVIAPDSPAPASARGIVLDILTFQPQSGEVVLDADWTLVQGTQSNPVLRRSLHLTEAAAASAQGQAAAMSKLLGELAGRMAADIAEASRSGGR